METLKINIPKGFKIGSFNQQTGEVTFVETPKDVKERLKTFDDVLADLGISPQIFDEKVRELEPDEKAYIQLKHIVKSLNEGWEPNWEDSNQYKYYPFFTMGSPSGSGFSYDGCADWYASSNAGSRLCFKNRELAVYAGKQFLEIYKQFLSLNKE